MPTSWPIGAGGSAVVVPDSAPQSGSAPGSGGAASPGRVGIGADGVDQHHARTGEKYGHTTAACSSPSFAEKVKDGIPFEVREALLPLVQLVETVNDCIASMTRRLKSWARRSMDTRLAATSERGGPDHLSGLRIDPGGSATIASSREVGPYLGLVPKQEDSGIVNPS
jgi:hypothetical protein